MSKRDDVTLDVKDVPLEIASDPGQLLKFLNRVGYKYVLKQLDSLSSTAPEAQRFFYSLVNFAFRDENAGKVTDKKEVEKKESVPVSTSEAVPQPKAEKPKVQQKPKVNNKAKNQQNKFKKNKESPKEAKAPVETPATAPIFDTRQEVVDMEASPSWFTESHPPSTPAPVVTSRQTSVRDFSETIVGNTSDAILERIHELYGPFEPTDDTAVVKSRVDRSMFHAGCDLCNFFAHNDLFTQFSSKTIKSAVAWHIAAGLGLTDAKEVISKFDLKGVSFDYVAHESLISKVKLELSQ